MIPKESSLVIAVAGVDALGSILDEAHVCRAEIMAALTGRELGSEVDEDLMARIMSDKGLWKVPAYSS